MIRWPEPSSIPFLEYTAGYLFITKTDDKKYSATLIPNCITMATMIKVLEFFLKRVCWVRLFIEISMCAR